MTAEPTSLDARSAPRIMQVMRQVAEAAPTWEREAFVREVARRLGYRRPDVHMCTFLRTQIRTARLRGIVRASGRDRLTLHRRHITCYPTDELCRHLVTVVNTTSHCPAEMVHDLVATHLGFGECDDRDVEWIFRAGEACLQSDKLFVDHGFLKRRRKRARK